MQKSECALAIEGFTSTEPARLRALPAGCTLDDARQSLKPTKAQTPTYLGSGDNPVRLYWFESEKLKEVRVWVDKADHVILIDTDFVPAPYEQYVQVLGEPDDHLDYPWSRTVVPGGDNIWLSRGVSIVWKPGYTNGVVHVGIFRAGVSLDEYQKSIQYTAESDDDEG